MRSVRRLLILATLATGVVAACSRDTTDPFAPLALALTVAPSVDTIFVSDSIVGADAKKLAVSATTIVAVVPSAGNETVMTHPTRRRAEPTSRREARTAPPEPESQIGRG